MTARFACDVTPARAANDDLTRPERGIEIVAANSPAQIAAFADLVRSFVAWCRMR
jgi:hypothetical protein